MHGSRLLHCLLDQFKSLKQDILLLLEKKFLNGIDLKVIVFKKFLSNKEKKIREMSLIDCSSNLYVSNKLVAYI